MKQIPLLLNYEKQGLSNKCFLWDTPKIIKKRLLLENRKTFSYGSPRVCLYVLFCHPKSKRAKHTASNYQCLHIVNYNTYFSFNSKYNKLLF